MRTELSCQWNENAPADADDSYYANVGTLGDDIEHARLTCSYNVASRWGRALEIRPFPSFEQAAEALKRGEVSAVLVPAAYPRLGALIFDLGLEARDTFIMQIPAMVLAGMCQIPPVSASKLFHHPATTPLLAEVKVAFKEAIPVGSNSKACTTLLNEPMSAVVITNELCVAFFEMTTYQVLRPGVRMPFVVFGRSN